ncbi:MAG: helix-turn-helix domain-containing protein [Actinomycetota bacterium]|nr:helix-turn-helix domain-containing protein [Actinomycetota bacterium]
MSSRQRASVLIIGGSRYRPSRTQGLVEAAAAIVEQRDAASMVWEVGTADHRPPGARRAPPPTGLRAMSMRAHALMLVTPTYHGSYSGLIKHSLDQLDAAAVAGKPVALMATCGPTSTPQALDHLRVVVAALGATTIPSQVVAAVPGFRRVGERYEVADQVLLERVRAAVDELVWFARCMRGPGGAPARPAAHVPGAAHGNGATKPMLRNGDPAWLQTGDVPDSIMGAVEYIRENFSKGPLPLDCVAREACMSRSHFSRTFKRVTGTRFIDFVTSLRLAKARALLAESDDSVTTIAFAVGFQGLSTLERTFNRELGLAPSQYRKRVRAGLEAPPGPTEQIALVPLIEPVTRPACH